MVQVRQSIGTPFGLALILFGIDRLSKWWAVSQQAPLALNPGISFGWLTLPSHWQIVIIGLILVYLTCHWRRLEWHTAAILAGGWSNWLDRAMTGAVIDWLPIPGTGIINNLADYWIAIGVLGFVVATLFAHPKSKEKKV